MSPFYDYDPYADSLMWDEIWESKEEFETKVVSIGGITDSTSLQNLYDILSLKYGGAHTRYTDPDSFIRAIKRELHVEFPYYLKKKAVADDIIALTDTEIELAQEQLRNLVDQHDEPVANANTVAIDDLSTQQENFRSKIGKLQAKRDHYNTLNRDYLMGIYKRCDELFRQILSHDEIVLYEE